MRRARVNHRALATILMVVMLVLLASTARSEEYVAKPGDVLEVLVIGEPDISRLVTISPEGNIFLPLAGSIYVAGLTIKQVEARLVQTLKRFVKDPQVMVTFRQANPEKDMVFVLGQVTRPGPYEYRRGWTLAELLAMAGGPTTGAALRRALVLRRGTAIPIDLDRLLNGDTSKNIELKPGDVLVVPELAVTERVLVLGEVTKPGYQDLKSGDRVVDMITKAGGPTVKSAPERISIMRNGDTLKSDLEAFLRQGVLDQNVLMEPGDVVFVPQTDRRVLVMGAVAKPGPYYLDPQVPFRVLDAIAAAGGPIKGANLSSVSVVRQGTSGEKAGSVTLNLDDALKNGGAAQNILLKAGDVIFVPEGFQIQFSDIVETLTGIKLLRFLFGLP